MKKINKLQTNKDLARVCRILLLLFLLPRYTTGPLAQPFLSRVGNESVRQGGIFFFAGERARGVSTRDIGR